MPVICKLNIDNSSEPYRKQAVQLVSAALLQLFDALGIWVFGNGMAWKAFCHTSARATMSHAEKCTTALPRAYSMELCAPAASAMTRVACGLPWDC
jgi:hypothetical protein